MIKIDLLTKEYLKNHIEDFISILKEVPGEYWNENHFLVDLKGKWEYSLVSINENYHLLGYIIASDKGNKIHIHKFMVDSHHRGEKIGQDMFLIFEKLCKNNNKHVISLKVNNENKGAFNFYKKKGFNIVDNNNSYFVMEKSFCQ